MINKNSSCKTEDAEKIAKICRDMLLEDDNILFAFLFGSAATGSLREESDIDIAIMTKKEISVEEKLKISESLEDIFTRRIDLVDLRHADGLLVREVLTKGEFLFVHDNIALHELHMKMLYYIEDFYPYVKRSREMMVKNFLIEEK